MLINNHGTAELATCVVITQASLEAHLQNGSGGSDMCVLTVFAVCVFWCGLCVTLALAVNWFLRLAAGGDVDSECGWGYNLGDKWYCIKNM